MQINKTEQATTTTELGKRIQVGSSGVPTAQAGPLPAVNPAKSDSLSAQEQQQWNIMNLFSISEATQSSLVYCQRALRDFVKLHQVITPVSTGSDRIRGNARGTLISLIQTLHASPPSKPGHRL